MSKTEGDAWRENKLNRKERHKFRVDSYPRILERHGIEFKSHNNGQHLVVAGVNSFIDYTPGTDRWTSRSPHKQGIGIKNLMQIAKEG